MSSSRNDMILRLMESPRTAFSTKGVALLTNVERGTLMTQRLNYYVRQGRLMNLRRGIYAKRDYLPEEVAGLVYAPSYLSLEYVLQKAGVIFQYDSSITSVSYLSRSVDIDGRVYSYRKMKGDILSNLTGIEQRDYYYIATPERALLDTMYLNANYYFDNLNVLNKKRIMELLNVYKSKRLNERVAKMFK